MTRKRAKTVPTGEYQFPKEFIYDNKKIFAKFCKHYNITNEGLPYFYKNCLLESAIIKPETGYNREERFENWNIKKLNKYLKSILEEIESIETSYKSINKILNDINYM